jgi:hypothetical protein
MPFFQHHYLHLLIGAYRQIVEKSQEKVNIQELNDYLAKKGMRKVT